MELDVTGAVPGNGLVTLGFTSGTTAGKNFSSREDAAHAPQLVLTDQPPLNGDPVIVAAGDIACSPADAGLQRRPRNRDGLPPEGHVRRGIESESERRSSRSATSNTTAAS